MEYFAVATFTRWSYQIANMSAKNLIKYTKCGTRHVAGGESIKMQREKGKSGDQGQSENERRKVNKNYECRLPRNKK